MFVPPDYKQVPIARTCCKIRFCNRFKKTRFWRARRQRGGRLSAQPTAPLCRALLSFSPFFLFFEDMTIHIMRQSCEKTQLYKHTHKIDKNCQIATALCMSRHRRKHNLTYQITLVSRPRRPITQYKRGVSSECSCQDKLTEKIPMLSRA